MVDSTVVFITGVTEGIGRTSVEYWLARPSHIVIGSVRDKTTATAKELEAVSAANGSRLTLVTMEGSSPADPFEAVKEIEATGIDHMDIIIANAGGTVKEFRPLDKVSPEDLTAAVKRLLQKSKNPRWVTITSAVGSIGGMSTFHTHFTSAYGISKASMNWITMGIHCSEEWLTAFVVHPGLVQTEGGNMGAKLMCMEKAPHIKEQSVGGIASYIDSATREKNVGKFYNVIDGTELPW